MSFLSRLLGTAPDPRESVRPLWHRVIELARDPAYYADCKVADSIAGRFDLITGYAQPYSVAVICSRAAATAALCVANTPCPTLSDRNWWWRSVKLRVVLTVIRTSVV